MDNTQTNFFELLAKSDATLFLDNDIEEIVKLSCDADEINKEFYAAYPEFASKIYSKQEPSSFAKDELGFPSLLAE